MRNLLLLLLLTFSTVFGQDITHGVGMKHGVVWTNVRNGNNTKFLAGYSGQLQYELRTQFGVAVSAGVGYDQKGFREKELWISQSGVEQKLNYKYHLNYLTIPFELRYYFQRMGTDYFNIGISYLPGFFVGGKSEIPILNNTFNGYDVQKRKPNLKFDHSVKFDIGFFSCHIAVPATRGSFDLYLNTFFIYSFSKFELDYDNQIGSPTNQYSFGLTLLTYFRFKG